MKDALGHGSDAHQSGVDQIGRPQTTPLGRGLDVTHSLGVNSEHIYTVSKDGQYVGEARLSHTGNYVVDLGVKPEFRNQGIASALYNHIESHLGHKLVPSPVYQTEAGKAFWRGRK
jgi:GNAT superfamily N-acetyltransferase